MPTRHQKMLEIMAITHFFTRANDNFANEFNNSRKVAYDNWLEDKANKNP